MSRRLSDIAKAHGLSERTLQRYVKSGCDPENPESIREHIAAGVKFTPRKRLIAGGNVPESPESDAEELLDVLPPPTDQGAAAALKRLQEVEPQMFSRLQAAIKTGRPGKINPARDDWLKVADALRKYEEAVEMSKRDSQEKISKSEAIDALRSAAEWMRLGLALWLSSEAPHIAALKDPHEIEVLAREGIDTAMADAFVKSQKSNSAVPLWALKTLNEAWSH
jgi:hypothetical protein